MKADENKTILLENFSNLCADERLQKNEFFSLRNKI